MKTVLEPDNKRNIEACLARIRESIKRGHDPVVPYSTDQKEMCQAAYNVRGFQLSVIASEVETIQMILNEM